MAALPVILIFDAGRTNKKVLLFDEDYRVVHEESVQLAETIDEDGDPCEDVHGLTSWIRNTLTRILLKKEFSVRAVNFSGYGASFVCTDNLLNPVLPLYNYLKPFPDELREKFYLTYGGEDEFSRQTCSPVLGSLNSGMQLYRLKHERPGRYSAIRYALHLPQYLSAVVTGLPFSEITSIGCHTNLWHFRNNQYHPWVVREGLESILPPMTSSHAVVMKGNMVVGAGLHDSSSALIPYLKNFTEPFVLLSTGTWSISLNPFNSKPLSKEELGMDCVCYLSYRGDPVKASRLFAGHEYEQGIKRIAEFFHVSTEQVRNSVIPEFQRPTRPEAGSGDITFSFNKANLREFDDYQQANHALVSDIARCQFLSTSLVVRDSAVTSIFVDGGFSKNKTFMRLLRYVFEGVKVSAASVAQASALGAALVIHEHWNTKPLPADLIRLQHD